MKIIQITSPWCMSCIIMHQRMDEIKEEFDLKIETLDFDEDDVSKYSPGNILPVHIIIKDQKEVERLVGEVSLKKLRKVFKQYETI